MTRSLKRVRSAYKNKDVKAMIKAHNVKDFKKFESTHHHSEGRYLKSIVYGGLDGVITTFAVVAGVSGASLSSGILLILGLANLIADGISMAVGDYLSSKAQKDFYFTEKERESWEAKNYPKGEKQEMIDIYMKRGLSKFDARKLVSIISKKKNFFVDQMMVEELNLINDIKSSPAKNAFVTFISFFIFGLIPVSVYLIDLFFPGSIKQPFLYTIIFTVMALFLLGIAKFKFTKKHWLKSGLETLIIGGLAAGAAYLVGRLLAGLA
ncbi:VIT1/CCC1 transporter family protein [Candidatus Pacearchaeota archaeon]|nr:VIT1/CCC1 transporter family protein [Candidatus Pacearchaeota archaeon]